MKFLKDKLSQLLVQVLYYSLRKRPIESRFNVTRKIGKVIYYLFKSRREKIQRNIALIRPDLSPDEIRKGSLRAVEAIAYSWAAMLGNEFTTLEEVAAKLEVEGIEPFLDYYERGEKIIAVPVHGGPIDAMAGIIPIYGLRVYFPSELVRPRWLFKLMERLRLHFGGIIFEPVVKGETIPKAVSQLEAGRIVVLFIDIPKEAGSGVLCRIGDGEVWLPVGPVKLALEKGATIFPVLPSWTTDWKFRIVIGQPFELTRTGNLAQDIKNNTRRLVEDVFAPHIIKHCDQWLRLPFITLEPVEKSPISQQSHQTEQALIRE